MVRGLKTIYKRKRWKKNGFFQIFKRINHYYTKFDQKGNGHKLILEAMVLALFGI
jgi:hypothetical protein